MAYVHVLHPLSFQLQHGFHRGRPISFPRWWQWWERVSSFQRHKQGHFLFGLSALGFVYMLDLATRWFVEMKAGPRLNSATHQTLVTGRRNWSRCPACPCKLRDIPALSWGMWTSTCRRGSLWTGTTAFTSWVSGQGMENLLGRLQMPHFLIRVVVVSVFACRMS